MSDILCPCGDYDDEIEGLEAEIVRLQGKLSRIEGIMHMVALGDQRLEAIGLVLDYRKVMTDERAR